MNSRTEKKKSYSTTYLLVQYVVSSVETIFSIVIIIYTLLFHSLFKVEFDIDHFVLGEHRERY